MNDLIPSSAGRGPPRSLEEPSPRWPTWGQCGSPSPCHLGTQPPPPEPLEECPPWVVTGLLTCCARPCFCWPVVPGLVWPHREGVRILTHWKTECVDLIEKHASFSRSPVHAGLLSFLASDVPQKGVWGWELHPTCRWRGACSVSSLPFAWIFCGHAAWHAGSLLANPQSNSGPLWWSHRGLCTGPPGKSHPDSWELAGNSFTQHASFSGVKAGQILSNRSLRSLVFSSSTLPSDSGGTRKAAPFPITKVIRMIMAVFGSTLMHWKIARKSD